MPSDRASHEIQSARQDQQPPGAFPTDPETPGFTAQRYLAREVFQRRAEYVRQRQLRLKIGSWNVAACTGTEKDLKGWFVDGKGISQLHGGLPTGAKTTEHNVESAADQEVRASKKSSTIPINDTSALPSDRGIDLYALGLQEIVDINSAAEALRPYNDAGPGKRWKEAVTEALPEGYVLVAEQQLLGLLLLIYASPEIAPTVSSVSTTSVGTGLMGYMGNKGAVSARIILGETTKLVFINSHLAAGNDKASLERRNWDVSQIIQRTRFSPLNDPSGNVEERGDYIGEEDFTFWFGDLNYRLADIPGDDVRRLLLLHTRNEYDKNDATRHSIEKELNIKEGVDEGVPATKTEDLEPSEDPSSALTTITSLITHDQLHSQMRMRKAFHDGWQEGPITFLPTYKYDIGSVGMFDSSEKKRAPSWCDRILYRTKSHYQAWLEQKAELDKATQRDAQMKSRGLEKENGEEIIFDYDPETDGDGDEDAAKEPVEVEEPASNESTIQEQNDTIPDTSIELEYYLSHQRVLSSDHKPLDAIFTIGYDAVDLELKAKIHQEVVKEIDRQENEGRPSVTAIFESSDLHEKSSDGCQFGELRFLQEKVVLLTVANTSPVPATFEFINTENRGSVPSWLRIVDHDNPGDRLQQKQFTSATLQPGDSANLEVIALVHEITELCAFNEGISKPDDILVMRVHKGRDHFIPVQAEWIQSSFGLSIEKLIRVSKEGVRKQVLGNKLLDEEVKVSAPKELFRLTECLEESISNLTSDQVRFDPTTLQDAGWPFTVGPMEEIVRDLRLLSIREALDTATSFDFADVGLLGRPELLGRTITLFLSYLPGRIISVQLWEQLSSSLEELERAKRSPNGEALRSHVLDILSVSPPVSVSFTFITFMLAKIAADLAPIPDHNEAEPTPATPTTPVTPATPSMPISFVKQARALSLKSNPRVERRRKIEVTLVENFVPLIFEDALTGANAKKIEFERKKFVLAAFVQNMEDDEKTR